MFDSRADIGNDTFADTGDNSSFTGAADQTVDIGADSDAGFDLQLDTVFSHCRNDRSFNNFGVYAHLHCFQHVTSCQVDSAGTLKGQRDLGTVCRDQSVDNTVDVTAGQIMGFQLIDIDVQTGLIGLDQRQHDV